MSRMRRSGLAALTVALVFVLVLTSFAAAAPRRAGSGSWRPLAAVPWPASSLLLSEVQTGGASASDEFAELYNAGPLPADLGGLELVYVTSTGSTVTRKASWSTSTILDPGRHVLVANAAGIYAASADLTYSSGFAATGGAVALRVIGGAAVDAVGWGDATSSFVEGTAAPAPPAGSSIERRLGGLLGNGQDTNDNLADFLVALPSPQGLTGVPVPTPGPSASASAEPSASLSPVPSASVTPVPSATPLPSVSPTPSSIASPTPSPTASPTDTPPVSTPTPTPTPTPTTTPTPVPTPTPTPSPTPSPTTIPSPSTISIAEARSRSVGAVVTVGGVVTAEAGRLGTPPLIAIQDETGGIVVRIPDGTTAPPRGTWIELAGTIADPYGQIEVRNVSAGIRELGAAAMPEPVDVDTASLGEATEGLLVLAEGTVVAKPAKATSGDIAFDLEPAAGGRIRVMADASAGLTTSAVAAGDRVQIVGIAGQRASKKGVLDGYRIWLRGMADLVREASPSPSPAPTGTPGPASGQMISIADAIRARTGDVHVEGVVTIGPNLLDSSGRRLVVEDASAAIEVLLPTGATVPGIGRRVQVSGEIGRAYGAPRIKAESVAVVGSGGSPQPLELRVAPGTAHEWRLVRVRGDVVDVKKLGDRWRAELLVGGQRVPISGMAGAGILSSTLVEGRTATITGIVRRPYPTSADRRFAIVPRSPSDVRVGGAADDPGAGSSDSGGNGSGTGAGGIGQATGQPGPTDVDLAILGEQVGGLVRVGGLVTELRADGFDLDDGTAIGRIVLRDRALEALPVIEVGDALNAIGVVERAPDAARASGSAGLLVAVRDPAGVVRVGDPSGSEADTSVPSAAAESSAPDAATTQAGSVIDPGVSGIGIVGVVLLSAISLTATLVRRRRARRRLAARIAVRLATVTGAPPGR
jgi:hypothetical protein